MPHFPASDGRKPWRATMLTLFPEMFPGPLGLSLAGQALAASIWSLDTIQIRDFGLGRHRAVDDTPAGGGAGMVMRADVLGAAIDHARALTPGLPLIYMTPRGERLTQSLAHELAERRRHGAGWPLRRHRRARDPGPRHARDLDRRLCTLGGELAAQVLIDACVRLLPGVIGADESLASESFENGISNIHSTKPRDWEGRPIPEILLSGDHKKIAAWRDAEALRLTHARRPDLISARKKP